MIGLRNAEPRSARMARRDMQCGMRNIAIIAVLIILMGVFPPAALSQGAYYNPKDDQFQLLGLRRAKQAYEVALEEYERKKELFDKALVSKLEYEQTRSRFLDAEVSYQQALLAVMFEKQYVAIQGAVKYQSETGRRTVRLTIANTSGSTAEFKHLINIEDELFNSLQPGIIHDVYVSLLNDEQAIIGQPYEVKVETLQFGKPAHLTFTLLQDLDAVTVNIIYGNGSSSTRKIYLQKDASVNKVLVQSEQFSQEVELGGSASFDLALELFSGVDNTFKLEVVNLPGQINRYFTDPGTNARLSFFKFTESANTRRASLQVFLPDRPNDEVVIDRSMQFYVLAIPRDQAASFGDVRDKVWSEEDIAALNIGYTRLEIVPRGVGKLLVRAPQLYFSIRPNESVAIPIDLVNDGTRRLDNVEIEVDPPLNWSKRIDPDNVSRLDINGESRVVTTLTPPEDVPVGRYEARVRTTSLSDDRPIAGEDKTITIEIQREANVIGTALILVMIIGLVGGIVIFGVRLSRR